MGEAAARQFHGLLNDGKIDAIVAASEPSLKGDPKFPKLLNVVRTKLGKVAAAKQVGWNDNVNTSGHFLTLNFETKFEKGVAAESFVYRVDADTPVLVGWHINSDALIFN